MRASTRKFDVRCTVYMLEIVGKIVEVDERELVLVVSVKFGSE